jgi:hypothetical protein
MQIGAISIVGLICDSISLLGTLFIVISLISFFLRDTRVFNSNAHFILVYAFTKFVQATLDMVYMAFGHTYISTECVISGFVRNYFVVADL